MSLWKGKVAKDIDGKVVPLENIAKQVTLVTNGCFRSFLSARVEEGGAGSVLVCLSIV